MKITTNVQARECSECGSKKSSEATKLLRFNHKTGPTVFHVQILPSADIIEVYITDEQDWEVIKAANL